MTTYKIKTRNIFFRKLDNNEISLLWFFFFHYNLLLLLLTYLYFDHFKKEPSDILGIRKKIPMPPPQK